MNKTSNFRITSKNLDLSEMGNAGSSIDRQDLIGASAGCISLSVIETDPKEIHQLIENLDTEKIDGHYGIKDYLPNHQDNISGFLKYKSHDSLSEQEDIIIFLSNKDSEFKCGCDLLDFIYDPDHEEGFCIDFSGWVIVNTNPLIIMNPDGILFGFIKDGSNISQVCIYHDELDYGYGGSSPQEIEARSVKRYIRDPHKP